MNEYSEYHQAIKHELEELAKNEKVRFYGQQCLSDSFYGLLADVSKEKRKEMPVAEELQLSMSIGMALEGFLPISIFQRCDFLMRAMDSLVNHLNLAKEISRGLYNPKVIIFTTIGTTKPMDCGLQHSQDLTELLKKSVNFPVLRLDSIKDVRKGFELAKEINDSIILIVKQESFYAD